MPFFWLLDTGVAALIWLAIVLGFAVGNGAMFATQLAFFSELFGTNVRYSGVSRLPDVGRVRRWPRAIHSHRIAGVGRQLMAGCPAHHGGLSYKLRLCLPDYGDIPRRAYRRARPGARGRDGQGRSGDLAGNTSS